jgi:hypothetical protein
MDGALKRNMNVHVAVAYSQWSHYPINRMRNFAMEGVTTQWTYVVDTDEDTMYSMSVYSKELYRAISRISSPDLRKTIFAVTSWQWATEHKGRYPGSSKADLAELYNRRAVTVKAPQFPRAYKPPTISFDTWFGMNDVKATGFSDSYEPYYIGVTGAIIEFDPRFAGWGGNKSIQTLTMATSGYRFMVLPNVFTFVPDVPSQSSRHSPPPDPRIIENAWKEIGRQHGCSSCNPTSCVRNCPWIVDPRRMSVAGSSDPLDVPTTPQESSTTPAAPAVVVSPPTAPAAIVGTPNTPPVPAVVVATEPAMVPQAAKIELTTTKALTPPAI